MNWPSLSHGETNLEPAKPSKSETGLGFLVRASIRLASPSCTPCVTPDPFHLYKIITDSNNNNNNEASNLWRSSMYVRPQVKMKQWGVFFGFDFTECEKHQISFTSWRKTSESITCLLGSSNWSQWSCIAHTQQPASSTTLQPQYLRPKRATLGLVASLWGSTSTSTSGKSTSGGATLLPCTSPSLPWPQLVWNLI